MVVSKSKLTEKGTSPMYLYYPDNLLFEHYRMNIL